MSDEAFERLLDREVSDYAGAAVSAPRGSAELIERALDEVGSTGAAAGGGGLKLAAMLTGAGLVVAAGWLALREPGPTLPSAASPVEVAQEEVTGPVPNAPARAASTRVPALDPQTPEPAPEAPAEGTGDEDPADDPTDATGLSAAEQLRRAQQQRGAGQTRAAVATYRGLLETYPRSTEAKLSLLSLGEIELVEREHPGRALRYFDRYLRAGGPLSEEALHGRVRALHKLGREVDELEAIDTLLARHPNSVYAASVTKRRAELERG